MLYCRNLYRDNTIAREKPRRSDDNTTAPQHDNKKCHSAEWYIEII